MSSKARAREQRSSAGPPAKNSSSKCATASDLKRNTYNGFGSSSSTSASRAPVEIQAAGGGKENLLKTLGGAKDRETRDGFDDDDDDDDFSGRSKRTRGVCGTPTDEDKLAGKPRIVSPRLGNEHKTSILDACKIGVSSHGEAPNVAIAPPLPPPGFDNALPHLQMAFSPLASNAASKAFRRGKGRARKTASTYTERSGDDSEFGDLSAGGAGGGCGSSTLRSLISKAPEEYARHLHSALRRQGDSTSVQHGFGKKQSVACEKGWGKEKKEDFLEWCYTLGLEFSTSLWHCDLPDRDFTRKLRNLLDDAVQALDTAAESAPLPSSSSSSSSPSSSEGHKAVTAKHYDQADNAQEGKSRKGTQREGKDASGLTGVTADTEVEDDEFPEMAVLRGGLNGPGSLLCGPSSSSSSSSLSHPELLGRSGSDSSTDSTLSCGEGGGQQTAGGHSSSGRSSRDGTFRGGRAAARPRANSLLSAAALQKKLSMPVNSAVSVSADSAPRTSPVGNMTPQRRPSSSVDWDLDGHPLASPPPGALYDMPRRVRCRTASDASSLCTESSDHTNRASRKGSIDELPGAEFSELNNHSLKNLRSTSSLSDRLGASSSSDCEETPWLTTGLDLGSFDASSSAAADCQAGTRPPILTRVDSLGGMTGRLQGLLLYSGGPQPLGRGLGGRRSANSFHQLENSRVFEGPDDASEDDASDDDGKDETQGAEGHDEKSGGPKGGDKTKAASGSDKSRQAPPVEKQPLRRTRSQRSSAAFEASSSAAASAVASSVPRAGSRSTRRSAAVSSGSVGVGAMLAATEAPRFQMAGELVHEERDGSEEEKEEEEEEEDDDDKNDESEEEGDEREEECLTQETVCDFEDGEDDDVFHSCEGGEAGHPGLELSHWNAASSSSSAMTSSFSAFKVVGRSESLEDPIGDEAGDEEEEPRDEDEDDEVAAADTSNTSNTSGASGTSENNFLIRRGGGRESEGASSGSGSFGDGRRSLEAAQHHQLTDNWPTSNQHPRSTHRKSSSSSSSSSNRGSLGGGVGGGQGRPSFGEDHSMEHLAEAMMGGGLHSATTGRRPLFSNAAGSTGAAAAAGSTTPMSEKHRSCLSYTPQLAESGGGGADRSGVAGRLPGQSPLPAASRSSRCSGGGFGGNARPPRHSLGHSNSSSSLATFAAAADTECGGGGGHGTYSAMCPTPVPSYGVGARGGALTATPQQTPQQAQGWGSRPQHGDWGASAPASASLLACLSFAFEVQVKSLSANQQLSPSDCPSDSHVPGNECEEGNGDGWGDNEGGLGCFGFCAPMLPELTSSLSSSSSGSSLPVAPSPMSLAMNPLVHNRVAQRRQMPPRQLLPYPLSSPMAGPCPSPPLTSAGVCALAYASAATALSFPTASPLPLPAAPLALASAAPVRAAAPVLFHLDADLAPGLVRAATASQLLRWTKSPSMEESEAEDLVSKGRARQRRAKSLAKLHRVSMGMSARKSIGGGEAHRYSLSTDSGGGNLMPPPPPPSFAVSMMSPTATTAATASALSSSSSSSKALLSPNALGGKKSGGCMTAVEASFWRRVTVVGGVYLKRFEAGVPVLGQAPKHLPRVQKAELTHSGLLNLTVHDPSKGTKKAVRFFTQPRGKCFALRVLPTGLLVSERPVLLGSGGGGTSGHGGGKVKCYYLKQELYQFTGLLEVLAPTMAQQQLPASAPSSIFALASPTPTSSSSSSSSSFVLPPPIAMPTPGLSPPSTSSLLTPMLGTLSMFSPVAHRSGTAGSSAASSTPRHAGVRSISPYRVAIAASIMALGQEEGGEDAAKGLSAPQGGNDESQTCGMLDTSSVCMEEEEQEASLTATSFSLSGSKPLSRSPPRRERSRDGDFQDPGAALVVPRATADTTAATTLSANGTGSSSSSSSSSTAMTGGQEGEDDEAVSIVNLGAMPVQVLATMLGFFEVPALFNSHVAVCSLWSRAVVYAHASLVAHAAVSDPAAMTTSSLSSSRQGQGGVGGPPFPPSLPAPGASSSRALSRTRSMRAPGDLKSVVSCGGAVSVKSFSMLCDSMPWGTFLSEGAYKKVYRVVNARANPLRLAGGAGSGAGGAAASGWVEEAVSVMDVKGIVEAGAGAVVQQELKVSLLVSALVRRGVCPNFVETFGVFGSDFAPPPELWGADGHKHPRGKHPPAYPTLSPSKAAVLERGSSGNGVKGDERDRSEALLTASVHHSAAVKALQPKRRPANRAGGRGRRQQYIRMELCTHGDLEEFIHAMPSQVLQPEALRPLAFQMVFALYVAQAEFDMRHYDVKLLNFLLKDMPPNLGCPYRQKKQLEREEQEALPRGRRGGAIGHRGAEGSSSAVVAGVESGGTQEVRVGYGVAGQSFVLRFPEQGGPTSHRLWVKLGDYGTADVEAGTVGLPIGLEQFTTLENTPIEQLLLGTGATQTFAADTWALGLSLLHLFTGHCPYEELLAGVLCPEELRDALEGVWRDPLREAVFGVVVAAAGEEGGVGDDSDTEEDDSDSDDEERVMGQDGRRRKSGGSRMDRTLADTLYRFLVLFGLPSFAELESNESWQGNPVWRACLAHLASNDAPPSFQQLPCREGGVGGRKGGKGVKAAAAAGEGGGGGPTKTTAKKLSAAFVAHRGQWGVQCGEEPAMAGARGRLQEMGGMDLLLGMANFDATQRPTMFDCLKSELFAPLRATSSVDPFSGGGSGDGATATAEQCDYVFNHFL